MSFVAGSEDALKRIVDAVRQQSECARLLISAFAVTVHCDSFVATTAKV